MSAAPTDQRSCARALREAALLLLATLLFAGATALFHPKSPDYATARLDNGAITMAGVGSLTSPVLWIDARSADLYEDDHIPGAVLLNEDDWEDGLLRFMEMWSPDQTVIVYCDGAECHSSKAVADRLRSEIGVVEIHYLFGGWPAWKEAHP